MDDATSTGSGDDAALEIEQVDECEYEGWLGGFLSESCTVSLRFYRDGVLDGLVRQRKKQQLHGLTLLSTRKRKLQHDHAHSESTGGEVSHSVILCGFIQGRWKRRGDGRRVARFQTMKRRGHVDRQTLECRAEFVDDARATGTWRLASHSRKQESAGEKKEEDDEATESDECNEKQGDEGESVIENVFEWKRVDRAPNRDGTARQNGDRDFRSEDPLAVYPLAPGTYHFRGFTTTFTPDRTTPHQTKQKLKKKAKRAPEPPPRDECFVTMELRADGTLVGKSREVVYPQSCPISGTWEVGRLRYVLEYKVREAVGLFKYSVRVVESSRENDATEETVRQRRVLQGKWRNIDDNEAVTPGYTGGRGQLELVCVYRSNTVAASVQGEDVKGHEDGEFLEGKAGLPIVVHDNEERLGSFLNVFTTGRYVLKGKAVDDDGYEYESRLELELFEDGTVRGTCRELVYQQVQHLQGNWTRTTIQYELEYVVKKEVGRYWYQGRLESDGLVLHGAWCNMELLLKVDAPRADQAAATTYRGEKGLFSYAILETTQRWSHTSHIDFPRAFRERVRCVLLCSQRTHVLPGPLWSKIFAFCSHTWFEAEVVASGTVKREVENE